MSGRVFRDADRDGFRNPDELGLSGRLVTIRRIEDSTVVSAMTDSSGEFSFVNLEPGRYETTWPEEPGWESTTANPVHLVITSSGQAFTAELGSFPRREISGRVYLDLAADGTDNWGTDSGIAEWTLLLDANDNAQLDNGELFAVTNSTGEYSFGDVPVGTYGLKLEQRPGYAHLAGEAFSGYTVTVIDGVEMTDLNFALFQYGEVRGEKFADVNNNGVRDADEAGLSGWSIFVDSNNDGALNAGEPSTITDEQGNLVLAGVGPGDQLVREEQQLAWSATSHTTPAWDISFSGSFETNIGAAIAISDLDDATEHASLSFAFPFVGTTYSDIWISTNGFVWLGSDGGPDCCEGTLAGLISQSPRIAPSGRTSIQAWPVLSTSTISAIEPSSHGKLSPARP